MTEAADSFTAGLITSLGCTIEIEYASKEMLSLYAQILENSLDLVEVNT